MSRRAEIFLMCFSGVVALWWVYMLVDYNMDYQIDYGDADDIIFEIQEFTMYNISNMENLSKKCDRSIKWVDGDDSDTGPELGKRINSLIVAMDDYLNMSWRMENFSIGCDELNASIYSVLHSDMSLWDLDNVSFMLESLDDMKQMLRFGELRVDDLKRRVDTKTAAINKDRDDLGREWVGWLICFHVGFSIVGLFIIFLQAKTVLASYKRLKKSKRAFIMSDAIQTYADAGLGHTSMSYYDGKEHAIVRPDDVKIWESDALEFITIANRDNDDWMGPFLQRHPEYDNVFNTDDNGRITAEMGGFTPRTHFPNPSEFAADYEQAMRDFDSYRAYTHHLDAQSEQEPIYEVVTEDDDIEDSDFRKLF